jgi:predicted PurR-regulated permease PerM
MFKKQKKSQTQSFFTGLSNRIRDFRSRLHEIKLEKELRLAEVAVPPKTASSKTFVELSPASVAKSAAAVIFIAMLFYFMFQITDILLIFFISFLLAAALDPLVDRMQNKGIPRSLGVIIVYIVLLILIGMFVTNVVYLIAEQVGGIASSVGNFVTNLTKENGMNLPFAKELKPYLDQMYHTIDIQAAASQLQNALQIVSEQLKNISFGLMNVLMVLILTFFMTVEEKGVEDFFTSLFPSRYARYISTRLDAVKDQIGHWLRGQLLVSIAAAVISYIGLIIMGIDYALTLSIIAGICMLVPVIGRVFAWIITFPIVYNQAPMLSLWMSIYYLIVQQIEANILIPYIMKKAVGLSPIIIIFAMVVGSKYLGVLGLVLSIPLATTVSIFVKDYMVKAK